MLVSGLVRRFDTARGFGFVDAEDGQGDVLLHVNVLRRFGVGFVARGWWIRARAELTARGRRAVEVLEVRAPGPETPPPGAGPLEPARVKWFDRDRGFGFVNVYGQREDVFLHMTTLREHGFEAVAEGIAVAVRVAPGPLGPTVCEVRSWDHVNRPRGRRRAPHRPVALAAGRRRPAVRDDLDLLAAAAALRILMSGAQHGPRGWP
jgi:CspA family cold shock protein